MNDARGLAIGLGTGLRYFGRMTANPEVMRGLSGCSDRFRFADHTEIGLT